MCYLCLSRILATFALDAFLDLEQDRFRRSSIAMQIVVRAEA